MSSFLRIIEGPKAGTSVVLDPSRPLSIGRRRGDLLLDDPLVSGSHCRVECRHGAWYLKDLGSTNGTIVDGRTVRESELRPGAEILLGGNRLVLFVGSESVEVAARETSGLVELAWLLDEELVESRAGDRTEADMVGQELRLPPRLHAVIEVVAGQDAGKVFRLSRGSVTIGRNAGDVPLTDGEVSRHHAVVEFFGRSMVFLRDLGSTNGTFVNGRRVPVTRLRHGDTIGCGKSVMRLQIAS